VDARAFAGVQFTMTHVVPDPPVTVQFGVTSRPSITSTDDPRGFCLSPSCDPPLTTLAGSSGDLQDRVHWRIGAADGQRACSLPVPSSTQRPSSASNGAFRSRAT
jgi:hypothetical protein